MKKVLLATIILVAVNVTSAFCQPGIFDPNDVIVNNDPAKPPAIPPDNTIAKWVRTPRVSWNTDKFKAYYYNDMSLRIRFPKGYDPADHTKKYPVILFFHGGGEIAGITDNEYQLLVGAERFEKMIDSGQFNAFLVYPQAKVIGWDYSYMTRINNVLDSMEKYCNTDPDRIISMGLSMGGYAAMYYSITFPQRSSTTIASSPALIDILNQAKESFIHIPFWVASGGTDANPNPTVVQNFTDSFAAKGGKIRNSLFPMVEHNSWEFQWVQPYLLPAWQTAHKANPLIYYNRTKFISADVITARLGITGGFFQYQWQKDNVDIPGAITNELFPSQFGTYRVRFKRYSYSVWSEWSPNPAIISQDNIAPTTPLHLKPLFTGRTFVNLDWDDATDNDSVTHYDVYVDGVKKYTTGESAITADKLDPNKAYTFTVKARDEAGNTSSFSNEEIAFTTQVTNGLHYRYYEGLWDELPNFNALTPFKTGVSPNIDVNQKTPDKVDLYAFVWEGYINIKTPGTYTFETYSDDGSKIYFNSFYSPLAKPLVNNDGSHGPWARGGTVSI
ncbi:MAG: alpha/beta hydrolase-fold protein, partial [Chitinophagaceae bacterium]